MGLAVGRRSSHLEVAIVVLRHQPTDGRLLGGSRGAPRDHPSQLGDERLDQRSMFRLVGLGPRRLHGFDQRLGQAGDVVEAERRILLTGLGRKGGKEQVFEREREGRFRGGVEIDQAILRFVVGLTRVRVLNRSDGRSVSLETEPLRIGSVLGADARESLCEFWQDFDAVQGCCIDYWPELWALRALARLSVEPT